MTNKLTILKYYLKAKLFSKKATQKDYDKQIAYVKKHIPYYKNMDAIPIMDKKTMMEHFDQLNALGIVKSDAMHLALESEKTRDFSQRLKGVTVGLSSGTSGHRGIFLVSDQEQAMWVGNILAKALPKGKIKGHKVAFFMRADSKLYQAIQSKSISFEFFDMYKPIQDNLDKLVSFQPTILVAPPSMLMKIAKTVPDKLSPKRVISIAEVLEYEDSNYIKDKLKQDVIHQIYQCTEGFLGITCDKGTIHINEDFIYLEKEMIDEHRFYPIITDLKRRTQPMIRYRLNDILVMKSSPCSCGSKFIGLEKIEGRQDDIFIFKQNHQEIEVFPDFIRRCMLFINEEIEYRVFQHQNHDITIYISKITDEIKESITKEFRQLANDLGFEIPAFKFLPYEYDFSRKLKRIERERAYAKS
ncbi:putative adenylate-forming enzyme [Acholeplasma oculi]|uniref:Putative adenylate-forming enzyme n=2 Tax=Acholeplasma oculi TaxID=35623 RepID=A0A061AAP7_9MOLU|nr:F390 synthetase-related protein [Acholeplasma oculi]CDR30469.1 putative adenylate-forming enzyme [Acholeplasma oculi]SKC51241.1 putative adenylate-forming enzyme [Acholeplasma oculi]SUT89082.1 putative adenylate-forming enzyme [Acholeplasma oculi]